MKSTWFSDRRRYEFARCLQSADTSQQARDEPFRIVVEGGPVPPGATVSDVDTAVTYELFGAGTISACPDPDGAGPKTAVRHDHNSDGSFEHCHLSGYQSAGTGALEYHARVNNTAGAGQTRVLFCADPDQDGCLDEAVLSQTAIGWTPAAVSPTS